jgi:hypothetical protein
MLKDCFQLIAATGEFARGRLEAEKKAQDPAEECRTDRRGERRSFTTGLTCQCRRLLRRSVAITFGIAA